MTTEALRGAQSVLGNWQHSRDQDYEPLLRWPGCQILLQPLGLLQQRAVQLSPMWLACWLHKSDLRAVACYAFNYLLIA